MFVFLLGVAIVLVISGKDYVLAGVLARFVWLALRRIRRGYCEDKRPDLALDIRIGPDANSLMGDPFSIFRDTSDKSFSVSSGTMDGVTTSDSQQEAQGQPVNVGRLI